MTEHDTLSDEYHHAKENAKGWIQNAKEMLEAIESEEEQEQDDKIQELQDSALSVQVRSGWVAPGAFLRGAKEPPIPEEYEILLTTGGPALRIVGKLTEHCEPETAELQVQDWFIPWTRHNADEDLLLRFARHFWFGG
jgi:hypothetical protein